MKLKGYIIITLLLVCSTLVSGCSIKEAGSMKNVEKVRMFIVQKDEAPITEEMPVIKELEKRCGVKLELEACSALEAPEKIKNYIENNNVPDIVVYKMDELYRNSASFEPINNLITDKTPNLKKTLLDDPSIKDELTAVDGNIYALPMIASEKVSQVYIVRKDWLNKLEIPTPKTLDDFYNMLVKIRDKDPNANGVKDEIPFVTRFRKNGLMQFVEPFGITEEFYVKDGTVKYGAIDPKMKDALSFMHKLYQEDLVDSEYIVTDAKSWQKKVSDQQAGVLFDWLSRVDYFNTAVDQAEFEAVLPPALDGKTPITYYQMPKIRGSGSAAISKNSKHKEKIISMYDYIFSDEGSVLMNFGILNQHYTNDNGVLEYSDKIMANEEGKSPQIALWSNGIALDWPMKQDERYEQEFLSSTAKKARELYNPIIQPAFPRLKFTIEESEELSQLLGDIRTYKDEMIDRFIIGTNSLDEFDSYVEHIKKLGIDRVLEIYNLAYQRYNKLEW